MSSMSYALLLHLQKIAKQEKAERKMRLKHLKESLDAKILRKKRQLENKRKSKIKSRRKKSYHRKRIVDGCFEMGKRR